MAGTKGNSGGRNAKTSQQHRLEGTYNATKHAGVEHADPPKGRPATPSPLDGEALAEWDRMIDRMEQSQTLSSVDGAVLYQYCRLFAETEALALDKEMAAGSVALLEENIRGLTGPDLVAVFQEIAKLRRDIMGYGRDLRQNRLAIRVFLVELGQTPAARSRVKVVGPRKDEQSQSPLAQLQQQARSLRAVK
jgi:P27 family predicted phage terminase small subunit